MQIETRERKGGGERERKGCSIHLAFLDRPPRSVMQEPNRPPEIASSDCVKFDFNARNIPTHYVYLNAIYFSLFFFSFFLSKDINLRFVILYRVAIVI